MQNLPFVGAWILDPKELRLTFFAPGAWVQH
jgi:hypothetical protein